MLQRFVFLLFLSSTTNQAFETCEVLFVIDASSYWSSFRNELASVSTTANLLYSSSPMYFNANFWLYGNGDRDQPIPTYFYGSKNDFLDNVGELQSSQGPESTVAATSKLNGWPVSNALIVIYSASPQNLINIAGYNYTEQARTVAIHQNDGVDTSPISDYPSPQVSEYGNIANLILNACKHLPTRLTSTSAETMITSIFTNPSTPAPTTIQEFPIPCQALFVADVSDALTMAMATERAIIEVPVQGLFNDPTLLFSATLWSYGNQSVMGILPKTFIDDPPTFIDLVDDLIKTGGDVNVNRAAAILNGWSVSNAVIVLLTSSPQIAIDAAAVIYQRYDVTVGVSLNGQNMAPLAAITVDYADPTGLQTAIYRICQNMPTTTTQATTTTTMPTTTPDPCINVTCNYQATCQNVGGKAVCSTCNGNLDNFQMCVTSTCTAPGTSKVQMTDGSFIYYNFVSPGYDISTNTSNSDYGSYLTCEWQLQSTKSYFSVPGSDPPFATMDPTAKIVLKSGSFTYTITSATSATKVNAALKMCPSPTVRFTFTTGNVTESGKYFAIKLINADPTPT